MAGCVIGCVVDGDEFVFGAVIGDKLGGNGKPVGSKFGGILSAPVAKPVSIVDRISVGSLRCVLVQVGSKKINRG